MSQKKIGKTSTTCEYYSLSKTEKIRTQKKNNRARREGGARGGDQGKRKERGDDCHVQLWKDVARSKASI